MSSVVPPWLSLKCTVLIKQFMTKNVFLPPHPPQIVLMHVKKVMFTKCACRRTLCKRQRTLLKSPSWQHTI